MAESSSWIGPVVLFLLMVTVGLELTVADFRRIAAAPRAVLGGTAMQIVTLPLLTWAVVAGLGVPPVIGAGALLVAVSPGAGISNVLVAVAGANVALSVTLTALASVLCVVTLPTLAAVGVRAFLGEGIDLEVPVAPIMVQLALSLLLPIGVGMAVRARRPDFVARHGRRLQRVAFAAIALVLVAALGSQEGGLSLADAGEGVVAAGLWTALAAAIGWGTGAALRLPTADRFTYAVEFSTRNLAVAAIVAISGLGRPDLTLFIAAYVAIAYPLAFVAASLYRWRGSGAAAGT